VAGQSENGAAAIGGGKTHSDGFAPDSHGIPYSFRDTEHLKFCCHLAYTRYRFSLSSS
jgi:hypothetical protein